MRKRWANSSGLARTLLGGWSVTVFGAYQSGFPVVIIQSNANTGLFNNGQVMRRGLISRKGHQFIFFDDPNKAGVAIISSDGNLKISLNETNSEIHISSQGKVHVECQQDMTLESQANLKLKAQQGISLEASTSLDLKGGSGATLDGGPQLEVKASGQLKVSGAMVDVNNGALQVM